jgi:hypothetical protein
MAKAHPKHVEKHRKRSASGKTLKEKRANRKRFFEAHPEKVHLPS